MTNHVTQNVTNNFYARAPPIYDIPADGALTGRDRKDYKNARTRWTERVGTFFPGGPPLRPFPEEIDQGPLVYKEWRAANPGVAPGSGSGRGSRLRDRSRSRSAERVDRI